MPDKHRLRDAARVKQIEHGADGEPVHSLRSLLADLSTICASRIQPTQDLPPFTLITTPTPVQRRALELLGLSHRFGNM